MGVSKSGYYKWSRNRNNNSVKKSEILNRIREIYLLSGRTYGSPRVHAALKIEGFKCSRWLVEKLMRENKLFSRIKRKFRKSRGTNDVNHGSPNLLNRDFNPQSPNKIWASDVTFLWTKEGWIYLSVTLDLYSRAVVGWHMKERLDTDLTIQSLQIGLNNRNVEAGMIHHSDQGKEYKSHEFRKELSKANLIQSMSRKGNCWDNAVVESFFHTLKSEMEGVFTTREEAKTWCFNWIEVYYNRQRLHSTLGYKPPLMYEKQMVA